MSEYFRSINQQEFEKDIEARIRLGEIAVGLECSLRLEYPSPRSNGTIKYSELAISIEDVRQLETSLTRVIVLPGIGRIESRHQQSIALDFPPDALINDGRSRQYLFNRTTGSWDDALREIAEDALTDTR